MEPITARGLRMSQRRPGERQDPYRGIYRCYALVKTARTTTAAGMGPGFRRDDIGIGLPPYLTSPAADLTRSTEDRRAGGGSGSAAVDEELLPLDMRGVVGGEEQHGPGDMLGFADVAEWRGAADPRFKRLLRFRRCGRGAPDRGADRAGRHDVDADAARRKL